MTRNTRTPAIEAQPLQFSAQEQAGVYEARQILLRHLNQNPVLISRTEGMEGHARACDWRLRKYFPDMEWDFEVYNQKSYTSEEV